MIFPNLIQQQCDDLMSLLGETCFPFAVESSDVRWNTNQSETYKIAFGGDSRATFDAVDKASNLSRSASAKVNAHKIAFAIPLISDDENEWMAIGRMNADVASSERLVEVARQATVRKLQINRQSEEISAAYDHLQRVHREHDWLKGAAAQLSSVRGPDLQNEWLTDALEPLSELMKADAIALVKTEYRNDLSAVPNCCVGDSQWNLDRIKRLSTKLPLQQLDQSVVRNDGGITVDGLHARSSIAVPIVLDGEIIASLIAVNTNSKDLSSNRSTHKFTAQHVNCMQEAAMLIAAQLNNRQILADSEQLVMGTLRAMSRAIEARDPYTRGHSERVARLGFYLANKIGLDEKSCHEIYLAGVLHDIGKIGIPDEILLKPAKLTVGEMATIRQHPTIGHTILEQLGKLRFALPGVLYHHEQWDGGGYPHNLKGDSIPLMARVLAVADAFDAMASTRPYRNAMEVQRAREIISHGSGLQWDAEIANAFLQWLDERDIPENSSPEDPIGLLPSSDDWNCLSEVLSPNG